MSEDELADSPFEDLDAEPGEQSTTDGGPASILRKRSDEPLESYDGISLSSLVGKWPQRLDRAVHTATDAAPGELWLDLVLGGMGWVTDLVRSENPLDREPGIDAAGAEGPE